MIVVAPPPLITHLTFLLIKILMVLLLIHRPNSLATIEPSSCDSGGRSRRYEAVASSA
jgi:hypothetical protein